MWRSRTRTNKAVSIFALFTGSRKQFGAQAFAPTCTSISTRSYQQQQHQQHVRFYSSSTALAMSDGKLPTSSDFLKMFVQDAPLLDVRAPIEFEKGAFPNSVNVPILDDEQRALVGTCYKENGPEAAMSLGRQLITPLREQRVAAWRQHAEANPNGFMYCFRGGSRSQIAQQGLHDEASLDYPLVTGGYKAMRTFLMEEMEKTVEQLPMVMVGGRTASGKTHLLLKLDRHVDLEGLANHRGSSFGGVVTPQPTQINFENSLSIAFLKLRETGQKLPVFIEDEGRRIGDRLLPMSMHLAMEKHYPLVLLDTPMEERVQTCIADYVTDIFPLFQQQYGNDAHQQFRHKNIDSLFRIKKRLGVERHNVLLEQVTQALDLYEETGDESGFYQPTESVLRDFYDPMYDYQATQREGEVLFRGDQDAIIEWAKGYLASCSD